MLLYNAIPSLILIIYSEGKIAMRIRLLIAAEDAGYAEELSNALSNLHADMFEVSVCGTTQRLRDLLASHRFDAALLDESLIDGVDLHPIRMPMLLWSEDECIAEPESDLKKIRKYQRISSIAGDVLESYAKVSSDGRGPFSEKARISAFWSPAGGVGTTTAALACAACRASEGKQVLYLNLESFSSTPLYFPEKGKSISTAFEMLDNREGNLKMFIRGIRRHDSDSGIAYFSHPENFDDMNILSVDDAAALITACCGITDELVIDLSCICNKRTWQVFELADSIHLVTDHTKTAQIKLSQFTAQHNVFERIKSKAALVANKGALIDQPLMTVAVSLPFIPLGDEFDLFKTLSVAFKEEHYSYD